MAVVDNILGTLHGATAGRLFTVVINTTGGGVGYLVLDQDGSILDKGIKPGMIEALSEVAKALESRPASLAE